MTELEIIRWGFMVLLGAFGYMLKRELAKKDSEITELRIDIQKIKDTYVHSESFKEFKADLRAMFNELKEDIKALREKS